MIEFFAGIGGLTCVLGSQPDSLAIDIDQRARRVYELNFTGTYLTREIESISVDDLRTASAGLWWLSPPCQPYSRRGQQRDMDDPRTRSLLHLIELIEPLRPQLIALENVPGFAGSQACDLLRRQLDRCAYRVAERTLCPTQLGWPNKRPRFYLLASLQPLPAWTPLPRLDQSLPQLLSDIKLDENQVAELKIDAETLARFGPAMDRVHIDDPKAITACFGSSYGKSLLHAGSYVQLEDGWRRFHPCEVARIMGFPTSFVLPDEFTNRQAWKLLGNSLSLPVVRYVIENALNSRQAPAGL